jgi:hypothetical protein
MAVALGIELGLETSAQKFRGYDPRQESWGTTLHFGARSKQSWL